MKTLLLSAVVCASLGAGVAFAKDPVRNVSAKKHPNIAAAQKLAAQAYQKIEAAQKANEFDLGGHAQRAKEFLEQVNMELKFAAEVANEAK